MVSTRSCKLDSMEKEKDQTVWLDLPCDLLQLVASCLPLKDNIRASTVCKTWHRACVAVRVVDKPPWLIYFSKTEESYEFYDPSSQNTYKLEFPELSGFRVCYSKDGWLLMYNSSSFQLLFFNPFNRDTIPVPSLHMAYDQRAAFSCAPTSPSCLLFTVSNVHKGVITMKKCCPKAQEWETFVIEDQCPGNFVSFEQIVFSNGVFYCIEQTGCLSIFDPALNSWNAFPRRALGVFHSNGCFLTEYLGEIFVIFMYEELSPRPRVFKLDHKRKLWTERKTLGGLTIYASALSSVSRAEQNKPSGIRNCLCLSLFQGFKRNCIYYLVDKDEESIRFKWIKRDPYEHIWIVPPVNVLDLPLLN